MFNIRIFLFSIHNLDFRFFVIFFHPIILFFSQLNYPNHSELELKQTDEIEMVTGSSESDEADETDDYQNSNDNRRSNGDEIENENLDYEVISTEDIVPSSSTSRYPTNDCRGDDMIACPGNPNHMICQSQMCDGITDCPSNEDESPQNCKPGEKSD